MMANPKEIRLSRWWMGGVASAAAACFTQPLDTIKVHQQTQQVSKLSVVRLTMNVIKRDGFLALNHGLTAAVLRQLTYSTTRFAVYEVSKEHIAKPGEKIPFYQKVGIAAVGGIIGGFIGTPADLINVRMQNDIKLPVERRRNYRHVFDGLWRVYKEEGFRQLFSGASTATGRSVFMTIGQLSFYDHFKTLLLGVDFQDNLTTHFLASLAAGGVATTLTQPIDVIKTRTMNAKPGEYKNMWHVITHTAKLGPTGFFKGYVLRFIRLAPHTILTFVFYEQLRLNFGIVTFS
ncbi:mitochondrial dicarboxylate carrier-like [Periplaneta americana]|uniref:mitochondrial dicarboxylate carrier-like n=1 Tax=Periplaneta americana TaxID=6978 RepID=UPI0037E823A3